VGPIHLAVGLNNRALFWDLSTSHYDKIHFERDYLATIDSMRLNETYVSTLFDGKLQLHSVIMNFELIIKIIKFKNYKNDFLLIYFICRLKLMKR